MYEKAGYVMKPYPAIANDLINVIACARSERLGRVDAYCWIAPDQRHSPFGPDKKPIGVPDMRWLDVNIPTRAVDIPRHLRNALVDIASRFFPDKYRIGIGTDLSENIDAKLARNLGRAA